MKHNLNFSQGSPFNPSLVFVWYFFLLLGIMISFKNLALGICIIILSIIVCFTRIGVQIDFRKSVIMEYHSLFGIKVGKWVSIKVYKFITILKSHQVYTSNSRSGLSTKDSRLFYEVYLLDITHRNKLKVSKKKTIADAMVVRDLLSNKLSIPIVDYNPSISEKTKARKRK